MNPRHTNVKTKRWLSSMGQNCYSTWHHWKKKHISTSFLLLLTQALSQFIGVRSWLIITLITRIEWGSCSRTVPEEEWQWKLKCMWCCDVSHALENWMLLSGRSKKSVMESWMVDASPSITHMVAPPPLPEHSLEKIRVSHIIVPSDSIESI